MVCICNIFEKKYRSGVPFSPVSWSECAGLNEMRSLPEYCKKFTNLR